MTEVRNWVGDGLTESDLRELVDAYHQKSGGRVLKWESSHEAKVCCLWHGEKVKEDGNPAAHFTLRNGGKIHWHCFVCDQSRSLVDVLQELGEPFWGTDGRRAPERRPRAQGPREGVRDGGGPEAGDTGPQRRRRDYTEYFVGDDIDEGRLKQFCEGYGLSPATMHQYGYRWVRWLTKNGKECQSHGWPLWFVPPEGPHEQTGWHLRLKWRFGSEKTSQSRVVPDSDQQRGFLLPLDLTVESSRLKNLLVCEGITDTMTAAGRLGILAVGRAVAAPEVDGLVNLVRRCGNPEVTWLLDNDGAIEKARECARELATMLGSPIRVARLKNGARDLRAYVDSGGTREGLKDAMEVEIIDPEVDELPDELPRIKEPREYGKVIYEVLKDRIRYSDGMWWAWDGVAWVRQPENEFTVIGPMLDRIQEGVESFAENEDGYTKAARKLHDPGYVEKVFKSLRWMEGISIRGQDWEPEPHMLGFQNGAVDLRTLELHPPDPKRLIRQVVPWPYDENADYSAFVDCLFDIFKTNEAVTAFSRAAGYTVTGDMKERRIFWLKGQTKSGKSMLMRLLAKAVGPACEQILNPDELRENKNRDELSVSLSKMAEGRRFIHGPEVAGNMKLDAGLMKSISGGDSMAYRGLRQATEGYPCRGHLWVVSNEAPNASALDEALWARIYAMTTRGSFHNSKDDDPGVEDRLLEIVPAIAVWLAHQAHEYYENGLPEEGTITDLLAAESRDTNPAVQFCEAYLELNLADGVLSADLNTLVDDFNESRGKFDVVRKGKYLLQDLRAAIGADESEVHGWKDGEGTRYTVGLSFTPAAEQRLQAIKEASGEMF